MRLSFVSFAAVALLVGAGGCGDDGGGTIDVGSDDAGGGDARVDAGSPDAGGDDAGGDDAGGDDAGGDDAGGDDGGSDAGPDGGGGNAFADFASANAEFVELDCMCTFTDQGFDTVEDCQVGQSYSAEGTSCGAMALTTAGTEALDDFYRCLGDAEMELATCLEGVTDCDMSARDACFETFSTTASSCTTPPDADFDAMFSEAGTCTIGAEGTCPDETDDTGMTGSPAFTGSTFEAGDDLAPSGTGDCGGTSNTAPDHAVSWTAPAAGDYTFDTRGSSYDTLLYVLDGGCEGAELACNDDTAGLTSELTVTLDAGQTIVIVIDGYDELSAGDFELNIASAT